MAEQNNRLGTLMMIAAVLIFALQDGVSRHLGSHYNTFSIVMLRYWVFLIFGYFLVRRRQQLERHTRSTRRQLHV
jgi:drug/metabolite transporter (DMT)-like permease